MGRLRLRLRLSGGPRQELLRLVTRRTYTEKSEAPSGTEAISSLSAASVTASKRKNMARGMYSVTRVPTTRMASTRVDATILETTVFSSDAAELLCVSQ